MSIGEHWHCCVTLPLHVDTSPYVPMPLVIYFIFCTNVRALILFFFNLGLNLGAVPRMGR